MRVLYSMGSRGLKQWVVTSKSHMGEMRVSDWSRPKILRSDWLGPIGAIMTTPISVLPCFAKFLERIVTDYIVNYLNDFNVLCENQYDFRKNRCSSLALVD